ncbi:hypothetical protein FDECE_18478 [Fusarium decemcellulare]|nr:hypothetical protein FDECE_18478 [Fusarium decemcellulare]
MRGSGWYVRGWATELPRGFPAQQAMPAQRSMSSRPLQKAPQGPAANQSAPNVAFAASIPNPVFCFFSSPSSIHPPKSPPTQTITVTVHGHVYAATCLYDYEADSIAISPPTTPPLPRPPLRPPVGRPSIDTTLFAIRPKCFPRLSPKVARRRRLVHAAASAP